MWVLKKKSFCILDTNPFLSKMHTLHIFFFLQADHTHSLRLNFPIMSPAKSPGSSHCKGKAVAFDPPVVSEEVDRSDSERSVEEEAERDPNGECAPLIDPWYEISPYFPKAPGEYVPPPPGRVLITLVRRDPDVS